RVDLDVEAAQLDGDGGAGRERLRQELLGDLVELLEVVQAAQVHAVADRVLEAGAGGLGDGLQVAEGLADLVGERLADALPVGVERALAGEVDDAAVDDALGVGAGRRRGCGGRDRGGHGWGSSRVGRWTGQDAVGTRPSRTIPARTSPAAPRVASMSASVWAAVMWLRLSAIGYMRWPASIMRRWKVAYAVSSLRSRSR